MSFLYPLGFLILLAIPVLIIIYILRNKYKESTVSSSYIWELSKKFLKRKNPLNSFSNLLTLILQCLVITFLAISLANPVFTFKDAAENYVFILDSSASMQMKGKEKSRFDEAKDQIINIADQAKNGSTFTLIASDSESQLVCQNVKDKVVFDSFIKNTEIDEQNSSLDNAFSIAQKFISEGKGSKCYLATDKKVASSDSFTLIDVSSDLVNYGISDMKYELGRNRDVNISLKAASYSKDATVRVEFYINDISLGYKDVETKKGEFTDVKINVALSDILAKGISINTFTSMKAKVKNTDDQFDVDSEYYVFNNNSNDVTNILVVSNSPYFFTSVFDALNKNGTRINYQTFNTSQYNTKLFSGFDIYFFDCFSPTELPSDGAVWLFNSTETVPESGFLAQKEVDAPDPGVVPTYSNNTEDLLYKQLTKNLIKREFKIKTYMRYSLTSNFTTILSYNNLPFIFAGRNNRGQRQVVVNFDIHDSDFALIADFIILMRNFINYSKPTIIDTYGYNSSDTITLSLPDNTSTLEVVTPSGKVDYPEIVDLSTYKLTEVGKYVINFSDILGSKRSINIYSAYPLEERDPTPSDESSSREIVYLGDSEGKADSIYDDILPVVIVAVIFFLADWILYGHEQF